MKRIATFGLALATALGSSTTHAEGPSFGARAHTVIVLDSVGGLMHETLSAPDERVDLALSSAGSGTGFYAYGVITRFGIHRFLGDTVSIGAGLHYSERSNGSLEVLGQVGSTTIAFAPRVGFAIPVTQSSAFWLRFGLTYQHVSYDHDAGSQHDVLLGGELFYVYTPVDHFGVTFGPTIERGIEGRYSTNGGSTSTRRSLYGLAFGFLFDL